MRSGKAWRTGVVVALLAVATPVLAQGIVSDSYSFLKAVRDRDGSKTQELLDKSPASTMIGSRDRNTGETALHIVTKRRDLTWVQFMLARGASVDARDDQGLTALAVASQLGWSEGVQQLLEVGATVDLPDNHGETPLILATQSHDLATVRLLVGQGADPHITDNVAGLSAIDYATRDGRSPLILKTLQEAKPKPKKPQVAGPTISGR